jgi:hypothetical protein
MSKGSATSWSTTAAGRGAMDCRATSVPWASAQPHEVRGHPLASHRERERERERRTTACLPVSVLVTTTEETVVAGSSV